MTNSYDRPPEMIISPDKDYYATLRAEKGSIRVKLLADKAPETVNNFVFLAREGYFDGTTFHRVIKGPMVAPRLKAPTTTTLFSLYPRPMPSKLAVIGYVTRLRGLPLSL